MKEYKFCQSCGFPLKKDKKSGGTEKDGSKSRKYCSMCYENGAFLTPPEINTAEKMQKFCIQEMKKDKISSFFAWLATRTIPKLERWKQ
ncbi:MAG: zinc ribbon domain-containing protein [Bacteroidetes bacterium]|nr:zinc ribbon domain-containing protein [Bacteroidota bacterium]